MAESYCCIKCRGDLEINVNFVRCTNCKSEYPISEGILIFSEGKPRFKTGDVSFDRQLNLLAKLSKTDGCIAALRNLAENKYPGIFEYATDLSRTDFKYLLPLTKESSVLDIGAGHGLISLSLSRTANRVYALDKLIEHCKFIQPRALQEGINNLSVACGGLDCNLPYCDKMFDIVILNGVFEWLGFETTTYSNVKNIQMKLLREINRVLKENGTIYITTKNKYSLEINLSKNYHNNGIRGVLLLPDGMINWLSKRIAKKEYLSGLLSLSQYIDVFKDAGLYIKKVWVPLPNFRYPQEFRDYNMGRFRLVAKKKFVHTGRVFHFLHSILPWSIEKKVCYSYSFVLKKKRTPHKDNLSVIESIIKREPLLHKAEVISMTSGSGYSLASAVLAHLGKEENHFICKISRFEGLPFLQREYNNLKKIELIALKKNNLLPEVLSFGNVEGFDYLVLPYYFNNYLSDLGFLRKSIEISLLKNRLLSEIVDLLFELSLKTKKDNGLSFQKSGEAPISNYLRTVTDDVIRKYAYRYLEVLQRNWSSIPLVYMHNDLAIYNIIIEKRLPLKFKIMDWESMTENGFPAVDLIRICQSLHVNKKKTGEMVKNYCLKLGIAPNVIPSLIFLNLVLIREKHIVENQCHLLPGWQKKESLFLKEIHAIEKLSEEIIY